MMMSPHSNKKLVDVGCGTGDVGKLFLDTVKFNGEVFNVDPNKKMLEQGKKRFKNMDNVSWQLGRAENLKFKSNFFDYYTISFGLRNTKDLNKSLKEAFRVLKPGGRFLCLEFSKISNPNLRFIYKNYSKLIPKIGKIIVGKSEPYEYLVESIDKFINQNQLIELMKKNGFENCKYRDLTGGVVSIHSGWKI
tara:strand:- start:35 stop:610 length:576 start_codon:yes stop_codon:yes gene_type:complete